MRRRREKEVVSSLHAVKLPLKTFQRKKQQYDYFLVLDFEATCDAPENIVPQEIIEFPVLKVNGETFKTESIFHSYIKPKVHPEITPFCTRLTGIIQDMVDDEPHFEDVFANFNRWMKQEGFLEPGIKFSFVTCGDWDLKFMLPAQCQAIGIPVPPYMRSWINIKMCFADLTRTWPRNLMTMIEQCELTHVGKLHSGIDDCKNIANIMKDLADRSYVFEVNGAV